MSLVGLLVDKRKGPAIMGLVLSGALVSLVILVPLILACFR